MTALPILSEPPAAPARLVDVADRLRDYAEQSKAPATWRAYRSDWRHFAGWCDEEGLALLPASSATVARYLDALAQAGYKAATLQRRLSSIAQHHQAAGHASPTKAAEVRLVWTGIRRKIGTAQRAVSPATTDVLRTMIATLDDRLGGVRDRALLLLGFAGAFRRSELVALDVGDVVEVTDGLRVTLRRSKTDQEGAGVTRGVPYGSHPDTCPVRAWRAWLAASGITEGAAFRPVDRHGNMSYRRLSDKAVALVVKRCAERAGLDAAVYSGHSLRAGLATAAATAGVAERDIMRQTGHKSLPMVRRYIRDGSVFRDNAAAAVGL